MKSVSHRKGIGSSFIELCTGIAIMVPIILVLFDCAILIMGVEANDTNCRMAARAAAAGSPDDAKLRAQTIILDKNSALSMVSNSQLVEPVGVEVLSQPETEKDLAKEREVCLGGPVIGTTTVTTQVQIRPLLIHRLYGGTSPITFTATHSFPISYTVPSH